MPSFREKTIATFILRDGVLFGLPSAGMLIKVCKMHQNYAPGTYSFGKLLIPVNRRQFVYCWLVLQYLQKQGSTSAGEGWDVSTPEVLFLNFHPQIPSQPYLGRVGKIIPSWGCIFRSTGSSTCEKKIKLPNTVTSRPLTFQSVVARHPVRFEMLT